MTESVKQPPELKKKTLTQKQLKLSNFSLGKIGEQKAKKFLLSLGYKILEINIRVGNYELDLVAHDPKANEIVFIEVKTRATDFFGNPSEAVTTKKLQHMNLVASRYLKSRNFNKDYRFDIIAISENGIEHFENISWP